jgi:hypothetical protein
MFETHHKLFTLLKAPQERSQSTNIHGVGQDGHEMVQDPGDFAEQGPDVFGTVGDLNVQQLLHSKREALLVGHHRNVVESVEVGQRLQVCAVLDELLCASVQEANVGIGAHNLLTIEFENQSQHTVGSGMLGTKVDCVVPDFAVLCVFRLVLGHADILRVLGIKGAPKVLVGGHHARALVLFDLCIPARHGSRQASCNGSRREGCSELWAGGVETQPLGRVAGQTRKGSGHGVAVSLEMPVKGLNGQVEWRGDEWRGEARRGEALEGSSCTHRTIDR